MQASQFVMRLHIFGVKFVWIAQPILLTMKKLLLLLTILIPTAVFTQFDLGIKVGPVFTKITYDDAQADFEDYESPYRAGFQGGVFSRIGVKKFYLAPEVLYTLRQTQAEAEIGGNTVDVWENSTHSVDVPIQAGYYFIKNPLFKLRAQTGPVFSFQFAEETEVLNGALGVGVQKDPDLNTAAMGWRIGAGVDIWKVTLDAGYEFGVTDVADDGVFGDDDTRNRANIFYLAVGLKIF